MPAIIVLIFLIRLRKESVGKEVQQFSSDLGEIVPVCLIIFIAPIIVLIIHRRHLQRLHHHYLQHLHHHHHPQHLQHHLNFRFGDQLGQG